MARGVNKVILVGNMGKDPDIRYTPGGAAVANVTIATSEQWKDKNTGEKQEKTEWHRVVIFGHSAETAQNYLRKGSAVLIKGKLQTRKWDDKDGNTRYTTEVVADMYGGLVLIEKSAGGGQQQSGQGGFRDQQQKVQKSAPTNQSDFEDDDIPF